MSGAKYPGGVKHPALSWHLSNNSAPVFVPPNVSFAAFLAD